MYAKSTTREIFSEHYKHSQVRTLILFITLAYMHVKWCPFQVTNEIAADAFYTYGPAYSAYKFSD